VPGRAAYPAQTARDVPLARLLLTFLRGENGMHESEVARVFAEEIPEVASGDVEIKSIARLPGNRSKLALISHDPELDCVGVCVGIRGIRIRKVCDQLNGERIDLVRWSDSPETLIAAALQPAAIRSVVLHPEKHRAIVSVAEDQLSLALGRGNANRDLASLLCGWVIEITAVE
jgi:N utilization substance protein A